MADWWKSLSFEEQKAYLKKHPNSKKALEVKRIIAARKRREAEQESPSQDNYEPVNDRLRERAIDWIIANKPQFTRDLNSKLESSTQKLERKLKTLEDKDLTELYQDTVKSIKLKDRGAIRRNIKKLTTTSGIVLIASVALSLALGTDLVSNAGMIMGTYGNEISHYTDKIEDEISNLDKEYQETKFASLEEKKKAEIAYKEKQRRLKIEYLKKVHEDLIQQAKNNAENPEKVADSLMQPKSESDDEEPSPENVETSSVNKTQVSLMDKIVISSNHESDLIKALIKLEKLENASISNTPLDLLNRISVIETAIPTAASIMVSSIGKASLSNRAKILINKYYKELAKNKSNLTNLASKNNFKKSNIDHYVKKIKHGEYSYSKTFVINEENKLQPCEHHTLFNVPINSETASINRVEIYGYVVKNNIYISAVKNSDFIPKSFSCIKPRELSSWLKNNI